jgi:RNA polymerase sigma-70 factor (ECF subfamily)
VVQDALLRAYRARGEFRGKSEEELAAWLNKILKNTLNDTLRRAVSQKRNYERQQSLGDGLNGSAGGLEEMLSATGTSPSGRVSRREQIERMHSYLRQIPERQRRALELKYLHDASLEEIAAVLNCSLAAAGGLIRRGLKSLAALMGA